jgi:opacity protein-like surface antigen
MYLSSIRFSLRKLLCASLLALSAVSLSANWSLGIKGGFAPITSGDFHRAQAFDGSVLVGQPAGSLPVVVEGKSFDDVFGSFEEIAFEATYEASERFTYLFGVSWLSSSEADLRVGTAGGSQPFNASFSEYEDFQIYGGVRYNFQVNERWTPYVAAQLGYTKVDPITATFSVPGTTFDAPYAAALTNAKFYDATDYLTYGVLVGVEYSFNENSSLAIETGYFDQGSIDGDDSVLSLLGLSALNDEGDLSYVPVRLSFKYRF